MSLDLRNASFTHALLRFTESRICSCLSWKATIQRCPTKMYILLQTDPLCSSCMPVVGVLEEYLQVAAVFDKIAGNSLLLCQKN